MQITANWYKPIKLKNRKIGNFIFYTDLETISEKNGCYVFYSKIRNKMRILYIGKAENLRKRIEQQFNNVSLMMGIKNSQKGNKYLIYCEIGGKKGTNKLNTLEAQLIKYATLDAHALLNKKGTKIKYNKISFIGNRDSENIFGREMYIHS